jgi:Protein of unknown function (DUF2905)
MTSPTPASTGLLLVVGGIVLVLIGVAVWAGAFSWFGRLPGDIRIEREGVRIYIPLVSMILLSAVLTLVLNLVNRLR